jgi:hypothetical protein
MTAEETEKSIRRIRELTKAPFGIGATLMMVRGISQHSNLEAKHILRLCVLLYV